MTRFSPSDDSDYDPQEQNFRDTTEALIRKLKGNCIPSHFSLYDLEQFIKDDEAVKRVDYLYQPGTLEKGGKLRTAGRSAVGITLHTTTGRKIKLTFY